MGRGKIVAGGEDGLYTLSYTLAPEDVDKQLAKLQTARDRSALQLRTFQVLEGLRQQELDELTRTLSALLQDWMARVLAGKEGDPPLDPADDDQADAVSGWEAGLLAAHNALRAAHGLGALSLVPELQASAAGHAGWLAANDTTGHFGANGSTPQDRIYAAGYPQGPGGGTGENCAYGQTSVEMVMEGWMGSPHHRANILEPRYTEVGFGYVYRKGTTWRHFWVANFGRPPA
jgi:uncharacterized protein YkwD